MGSGSSKNTTPELGYDSHTKTNLTPPNNTSYADIVLHKSGSEGSQNLNNSNPSNEKTEKETAKSKEKNVELKVNEPETSSPETKPAKQKESTSQICEETREERGNPLMEAQDKFNACIRLSCELSRPEDVLKVANKDVTVLELHRAPANLLSLSSLLHKLTNLQVVDISGNQLGPVCFRTVMYAMCQNSTITVLNMADNQADTDSSLSIGKMLSENQTLTCLDVSGNHLGKDYFSRCVGPALATNTSLNTLRCSSIGSTDFNVLFNNLVSNRRIKELNLSSNWIEDSTDLVQSLSTWLKSEKCPLENISLKNCGLKAGDLDIIAGGIKQNQSSLKIMNISGNKVSSHQSIFDFLLTCLSHTEISELIMEDVQINKKGEWKPGDVSKPSRSSKMQSLNMSNCGLKDIHLSSIAEYCTSGTLCHLGELIINNNPDLTADSLRILQHLMTAPDEQCKLEKLSFGQNSADSIPDLLAKGILPRLQYLNLRKAKISSAKVGALATMLQGEGLRTLVLDGIKLSGSDALQELFGENAFLTAGSSSMSLNALSLGGCQLTDEDLKPLCTAIGQGLPLHMLKVSGNRLTDDFLFDLVDSLRAQPGHCLALIDLSNNKVKQNGAKKLAELLADTKCKLNLRSLNISNNCVEPEGLQSLVYTLVSGALITFQGSNQQTRYEEEDMEHIYDQLASALDLQVVKDGDVIKPGCCSLPVLPVSFQCKLLGLGGCTGDLGRMLDSAAICTDFQKVIMPRLTLQHIMELASALKGQATSTCLMTGSEWNNIISSDKDAPSWLQLPEHRSKAIYMTGLPASISVQKMEGFLEMEADCNVQEVYLCKDLLTRKNNGYAWALLADQESVDKAVQCYQSGQAIVLGSSFIISGICTSVDDEASSQAQAKARRDLEQRMADRAKEDAEHRSLIDESYHTSQRRHAYRLAHPAYADGRIW